MNFITEYDIQERLRAYEASVAHIRLGAEARRVAPITVTSTRAQLANWVSRAIFRVDPCAEAHSLTRAGSTE